MPSPNKQLHAVIDTNVLISGLLSPAGAPAQVVWGWREGRFVLLLSADHEREIRDVLARPRLRQQLHYTDDELNTFLLSLTYAVRVQPTSPVPVEVRDPDDAPILAAALDGEADVLVTGDLDLLSLAGHPALETLAIITPAAFLDYLDRFETDVAA